MEFNSFNINRYITLLILYISICFAGLSVANAQFGADSFDREATIYTIYNVEVDEMSQNVTTSRARALRLGQRAAFDRLLRRITLTSDKEKLPRFSDDEIQEYITGFEINDERRSNVRYMASLVVHFNRDRVNELLSAQQIPSAETLGISVSVLPIFEEGGTLRLWERENHWRLAWEEYDMINNLVPIDTPAPSLMNRMYMSAMQAKNDNQRIISQFIEKNRLNELIVATARLEKDNVNGILSLNIDMKQNNFNTPDENSFNTLRVSLPEYDEEGESNMAAIFEAGVDAATAWVDDLWKLKVLVNYGLSSKIAVIGDLDSINDWLVIQKQLNRVNLVKKIDLKSIKIDQVDLEIEFSGEEEQLVLSLAQQGISLLQNEENQEWKIGLSGSVIDMGVN
ncbi:MAG: DUF2066 domain-containing protein [Emcibacteraceae bacterium]|nr:DUF2066 domain-containing protein [Emcibacteraceae bacterium]